MTIGKEIYKVDSYARVLSADSELSREELCDTDVLDFWGIDKTIYCMVVKKGHGYLRLENDENFIGGWIEVGQNMIYKITDDMILTVPEGSFQVGVSCNGNNGLKTATILRNRETVLDLGDIEVHEPQSGTVIFSVTPSEASVFIDGEQVDASAPISLEYGLHQLIVKMEGYKSITQYLRVGQPSAGIDIVLDAISDDEEEEESQEETITETDISGQFKVYIDTPEGALVYLDGNLIGTSPVSFKKEPGSHVIVFRKSGYETRSYVLQIDSEKRDITYSFAALVPYGETETSESSQESSQESNQESN